MKTMIVLAKEILEKEREMEFEKIFSHIQEKLQEKWNVSLNANEENAIENLLVKKRGELYRLLTVDSNFKRLNDGRWTLKKY
ncbi:DNA-directed RNA polymerase subunit delta [Mesomycoplasma molare]|uniref:Winged helix-turn-helix domain-containing protein n=1 Tax=Mesomycoplasma molare TaxID=171288 RepID=A0ABY5TXJ9_9BACT|nr:hypothetical protein [Mesomycoplasma molare]UWD34251.1 winged helix-turn-helix domain-containing protein [Mesomycoplasma molare]